MKTFIQLLSEIAMNNESDEDIHTFIHETIMSHPNASMLSGPQIEQLKNEGKLFHGLGHNKNVIKKTLYKRIEGQTE